MNGYRNIPKARNTVDKIPLLSVGTAKNNLFYGEQRADVTNRHLEAAGHEERIDHRSHADLGLTEQPTIHEGVVARALERKGIVSDRCELNRQIKADNALLRELRRQVKKLAQGAPKHLPALAEPGESAQKSAAVLLSAGISPQGQRAPEHLAEYTALCTHTVQSAYKGHPG